MSTDDVSDCDTCTQDKKITVNIECFITYTYSNQAASLLKQNNLMKIKNILL